jgi:rsbT co-antagonist protein RsbR
LQMTETLLQGIVSRRARIAIVDITGVRTIDTQAVDGLTRAVQTARLVGAEVLLTGLGPTIAQALVALDVDLGGVRTFGDLQSGIAYAEKYLRPESAGRPGAPRR